MNKQIKNLSSLDSEFELFLNSFNNLPPNKGEIANWEIRSNIKIRFKAFNEHVDFINESIKQETENLNKLVLEEMKQLQCDPDEEGSIYGVLWNTISPSHDAFFQIQWRSEFLVIYSFFEHTLNQLCTEVKNRSKLILSIDDLHGKGIERAKNYLVKVGGVKTTLFSSNDWEKVTLLGEIRNKIAHADGVVLKHEEKIYTKLKKIPHIKLEYDLQENIEIMLSYEYVKQA